MVAASWSVALKLIYDESTYLIDVFSVWNEVVGLASELTYVKLVAAERQILLFAAKSSFFYSSISQHIQSFRSALLRTLLEEHNTTPALECVKDALRVVIIDDCPLTRQIHEIFVTTAAPNAAVRLAANYSEALELYSDFRPHVILIDLNLNDAMGYNGYKLCSILHTQENTSMLNHREGHDTKDGDIAPALVVAVTGCSFDETMSCNFDAVWTKPLTLHAAKCILGHAWEV
jgi:CheY-like chemotaxis protein